MTCYMCKQDCPDSLFTKAGIVRKTGVAVQRHACKTCCNLRTAAWKRLNRERVNKYYRDQRAQRRVAV